MYPEVHFSFKGPAALEPDDAILAELEQSRMRTKLFDQLRTSDSLVERLQAIDQIGQSIQHHVYDGEPCQAQSDWDLLVHYLYAAVDSSYLKEYLYRIARWAPSRRCLTQAIAHNPALERYYYGAVCSAKRTIAELQETPLVSYQGPHLPAPLPRNAPLEHWASGFKEPKKGWDCFYYLCGMGFNVKRYLAHERLESHVKASVVYGTMVQLVAFGPHGGLTATSIQDYRGLISTLKAYAPSPVDAAHAMVKVIRSGNSLLKGAAAWELSSMQLVETEAVFRAALENAHEAEPGFEELCASYKRFQKLLSQQDSARYCEEVVRLTEL